jgi:outer membrane scaffolding protein for murein synthesis (MipA/OmpV family)
MIGFLLLNPNLKAKEHKLELGIGVASLVYPDYIGSKSYQTLPLVFPYIEYYTPYLSIDKNGINQKLFKNKNIKLDISVSGSLPSNSEDNKLRKGMDDLNFTFELGPKLSYMFYDKKKIKIFFDLATRAVFETNLKMLDTQGFVATSEFRIEIDPIKDLEITIRSGARFADAKFHDYYYGVDRKFVTNTRDYYKASGGYSGYKNKIGATYKHNSWWYGAYVSYYNIKGSVYENSPLIETKSACFGGFSLAYIFYVD